MGSTANGPGQPLDTHSFGDKTFTFVNVAWQPMCIDIHRDEETKAEPRIQAFNYNERFFNQIWLLRREGAGADWSLQNVGTGLFLAQDDEQGGRLWASKDIDCFCPRIDDDGSILLFSSRGKWATVAALSKGSFGEDVSPTPYDEAKDSNQVRWRFQEHILSPDELAKAIEAREAAEARKPPVAKAAAAALQTAPGGRVSDEKTVALLNKVGNCPSGFSWLRIDGGFRCEGGGHTVSDATLAANA